MTTTSTAALQADLSARFGALLPGAPEPVDAAAAAAAADAPPETLALSCAVDGRRLVVAVWEAPADAMALSGELLDVLGNALEEAASAVGLSLTDADALPLADALAALDPARSQVSAYRDVLGGVALLALGLEVGAAEPATPLIPTQSTPVDDAPPTAAAPSAFASDPGFAAAIGQSEAVTGWAPGRPGRLEMLREVELDVTAELGRTRMSLQSLLGLTPGTVVELDRLAGSPVDLLVNGTLIARGEVVVVDEDFGVRVSELIDTPFATGA